MMKTTYRPVRERSRRGRVWRWLMLAALLALLVFWRPPLLNRPATTLALAAGKPLWQGQNFAGERLGTFFAFFTSRAKLQATNNDLQAENQKLQADLLDRGLLAQENLFLRRALSWQSPTQPLYPGQVLSALSASPYSTVVVAVGEAAAGKIRPGDLAFYEQNILLGEVLEVFGQTVKVKLFSAPGTKFTVSLGKNNLTAQIEGRGGGNFSIALPRGVTVETGELALITSGLQNLIVAVIGAVEADPESSFQQVFLRLPLNLNELKYVVIRPSA